MKITYQKAGVNIDAGNELVRRIKKMASGIGGFAGLFPLQGTPYQLVSSTDGVGTKLKLAFLLGRHDTVGIDLVAMNVNDIICCGAKPLFFLDYFACGRLDVRLAETVIKGIVKGCKQADCVLLGGETAEMPGFYKPGEYDLAGFAVGVIKKGKEITGKRIRPGDVVIGIPSSGPHSNGFSLIRKVFSSGEIKRYGKYLIEPTKIYVREILSLLHAKEANVSKTISAIAHITGGGFYDNIERLLPEGCKVVISRDSWNIPEIFNIIQKKGKVAEREMYRTLNMGIGMIVIVRPEHGCVVLKYLQGSKVLGIVQKGRKEVKIV